MINYTRGDLLADNAEVLVNTVNCVGVMGKGLALAFRQAFPVNYKLYRAACAAGEVRPGKLFIVSDFNLFYGPKLIINFPTKTDWRKPSRYDYVESGLETLVGHLNANPVATLALPALGCGNGGLDWGRVKGMIEHHLKDLPVAMSVYEPV
ncbi:macro domain-containing protein [Mucilaginibacter sp. SMC90]|uniref:macro domain-containing protein n=1 Tax=Mucilaginibacter sp. SMC90 TaxID=2929803 RepID=UPI001FB45FF3|nr:macro domain-containing protein [Mucilaginibacter sp. SMC90]UOE50898.1 macro domain-containing protein [Mucilaginibacter sp. SMC90]